MTVASISEAFERAETFNGFGIPDMSVLEEGRRHPPALPPAMFGNAWPELVKLAADKGAPVDYVALSWLTVSAALIGSKRRCVPYPDSTWKEPSILWLGLVGDPSHNKSPALDPFVDVLRLLEDEKTDDHLDALNVWRADTERAKVEKVNWQDLVKAATKDSLPTPALPDHAIEPDEPRRRRHFVQDATPESLGEILEGKPGAVLVPLDPDAADVFDSCCRLYGDQEQEVGGLLKSFIGKLRGLTLRLALASELARWSWEGGSEPKSISRSTLEAAADFVADYAIPMAERVYGDAALPPVERNAATLARHIKRHKLASINTRNLQRKDRLPGLAESADIDPAIEALVDAGWLRAEPRRSGATTGRPSRDYSVNPAVWRA